MYKTALFIGRFQPLHNGHLYSLKKCLEMARRVVIVVAKSNTRGTRDDPWDYKVRRRMVREVVRRMRILERIIKITSCPDYPSDSRWVTEIKRRVGEFDVVVSNNEWTLEVFREAGYKVQKSGLYRRDELEGRKIREMIRNGDESWMLRVPKEVVRQIDMGAV